MSTTAKRSDPKLWEKVKAEVTAGDKGGEAGEWSARKAQLAVAEYKKSGDTHERYLPKDAREALSDEEYARTTRKKRADTKQGKQFSSQPKDVADKVKPYRDHHSKAELYEQAKKQNVPGRSKMSKAELAKALGK
jgi:hypothetical protein